MDNRTRMQRRSEARYMRAAWDRLEALLLEDGEKPGALNAHDLLTRAADQTESLLRDYVELSKAVGRGADQAVELQEMSIKAEARVLELEEAIRRSARNAVTGGEASCALDGLEALLPFPTQTTEPELKDLSEGLCHNCLHPPPGHFASCHLGPDDPGDEPEHLDDGQGFRKGET